MGSNGPVRNESMMKHSSFSNSFHIPFHHRYLIPLNAKARKRVVVTWNVCTV